MIAQNVLLKLAIISFARSGSFADAEDGNTVLFLKSTTTDTSTPGTAKAMQATSTPSEVTLLTNRSLVPQWYLEQIIWPQNQYYQDYLQIRATVNGSIYPYTFMGLPITDYRVACPANIEQTRLFVLSVIYKGWYGFDNSEVFFYQQFSCIYCFASLAFIFVPIFVAVLGTKILKRLMANEKTHVYLYYNATNTINIIIYVLTIANGTAVLRFLLIPFCYTGIVVAKNFMGFVLVFNAILMDCLYGMSCLIQALLALDRFVAVSFPLFYPSHVTRGLTKAAIAFSCIFYTALIFLANLTTNFYQQSFCNCTYFNISLRRFGVSLSGFVLGGSLTTQIFCCSVVFGKMVARKIEKARATKKGKSQSSGGSNAAAFSMLIGTCLVNVIGGIFVLGYHACNDGVIILSFNNRCHEVYSSSIVYVCTICSTVGFYLHCICSKPYRDVAIEILDEWLKKLFGLFGKNAPKLSAIQKNAVGPTSIAGGKSVVTVKHTTGAVSTVTHA